MKIVKTTIGLPFQSFAEARDITQHINDRIQQDEILDPGAF